MEARAGMGSQQFKRAVMTHPVSHRAADEKLTDLEKQLTLALWKAWGLERQGRKDDNEKSSGEIKRLNEERLKDLKEIARLPD